MKFVQTECAWSIVATGENSPVRMDGTRGCEVVGIEGQRFFVFERNGKIGVEIEPTLTEVCKDILTVAYPLGRWNDGKAMRPQSSENGPWSGKGDR